MKRGNATKSLNVLFVGNSFTARNDLPGLVATIAEADGRSLTHRLFSIGGASLRQHWNKGEAAEAIASGGYDYVLLQEQSTLPVKNAGRMLENVRLFADPIKASGARMALYMTWARKGAGTQDAITAAYTTAAKETGARLIPAGLAWQQFLEKRKQPVLHDRDGSHPTLAGSYLAACLAYGVLFGRDPRKLKVELAGLDAEHALLLQATAATILK